MKVKSRMRELDLIIHSILLCGVYLGIRNSRIEYTRLKYRYKLFANKVFSTRRNAGSYCTLGHQKNNTATPSGDDVLVLYMPNLDTGHPKQLVAIRVSNWSDSNDGHMMRTIKLNDIWEATTIG
jgi:hypothetical protein